jgi:hypothetical protein
MQPFGGHGVPGRRSVLLLFLFFFFLRIHTGRGYVDTKKRTADKVIEKFDLRDRLKHFRDRRTNPSISLPTILLCVLLMPLLNATSLLALDRLARSPRVKALFGSTGRKMVTSDSTIRRALRWLSPQQVSAFAKYIVDELNRRRMLTTRFVQDGPARRVAIVDGTYMSGHWMSVVCLTGSLTVAPLVAHMRGAGHELQKSRALIKELASLGRAKPQLLLLDPLYFDTTTITMIRRLAMHVLIKGEAMTHRTVVADAANQFDAGAAEWSAGGYDGERLCRWWAEGMTATFAGISVEVIRFTETRSKSGEIRTWWVVTTDHSLSGAELREAGYCRWRIENHYFKQLNERTGSKRFSVKDHHSFTTMLTLTSIGMALVKWAIVILSRFRSLRKRVIGGEKLTLAAWATRLTENLPEGCFAFGCRGHA